MAVQIVCIKKDGGNHPNPHEGITDFGWMNEETRAKSMSTCMQMVEFIEKQGGRAYVKDQLGNIAYIGIVTSALGRKYLRTYADGTWTDNLLSLPEC